MAAVAIRSVAMIFEASTGSLPVIPVASGAAVDGVPGWTPGSSTNSRVTNWHPCTDSSTRHPAGSPQGNFKFKLGHRGAVCATWEHLRNHATFPSPSGPRALHRNLDGETARTLTLTMHFPTDWDPYFRPTMSVSDLYHYGTQHFDHHRQQLTL
jgi:hypothetical protein